MRRGLSLEVWDVRDAVEPSESSARDDPGRLLVDQENVLGVEPAYHHQSGCRDLAQARPGGRDLCLLGGPMPAAPGRSCRETARAWARQRGPPARRGRRATSMRPTGRSHRRHRRRRLPRSSRSREFRTCPAGIRDYGCRERRRRLADPRRRQRSTQLAARRPATTCAAPVCRV
jgi:hypothetical protein